MKIPTVIVEPNAEQLVATAARLFVECSQESIAARGVFSVALAGGSTPRALYQLLSERSMRMQIDWKRTQFFFGDERAVAQDDELSNYRMAREALLAHVPIPEENVHRMPAERDDLEAAAEEYETELAEYSPLDLVLLGMGDDGHTASLFPGSPALDETSRLCIATPVASLQPHVRRLTISYRTINEARNVWLLLSGQSKAARASEVLGGLKNGELEIQRLPIQGVQPGGEYLWLLDVKAGLGFKE